MPVTASRIPPQEPKFHVQLRQYGSYWNVSLDEAKALRDQLNAVIDEIDGPRPTPELFIEQAVEVPDYFAYVINRRIYVPMRVSTPPTSGYDERALTFRKEILEAAQTVVPEATYFQW